MTSTSRNTSPVAVRLWVAIVAAIAVLALTLSPWWIVTPAREAFMELLHAAPGSVAAPLSYAEVESGLNALMFVPLGVALAVLVGRRWWILAPVLAFALSFTVENLQARIPGRVPDVQDILWNTVGGTVGALVVMLVRGLRQRRATQRAG
ncbi:VanZ family protein [Microbacterium gorillae]|uniref:VanZ family protein n=1 Tax=Microbacterium gorillae TaxID=1231063 RepID=UPI00058F5F43|nr:VanZ family protein [Microbacterium gorillae]